MIKINSCIFTLLVFAVFTSCNSRKEQEKQADMRLKHIELLIGQNTLNTAKIEIDSIHILFPRLVEKRRIAAAFEDTIVRRESSRTLAYCDSVLPKKQHELDSIQVNFRFEKNVTYQDFGNFVYKTQLTESNSNRIYLKSYVDENNDLYLISNYCGAKIDHNSVEVAVNDLLARTDTLATTNAANHSFTVGGMRWETLTYKNETANGVASFITQEVTKRIKVSLHGKKSYVYYLADSDKKAIAETYRLWIVKKDVTQLEKEIKKAKARIARINKFRK